MSGPLVSFVISGLQWLLVAALAIIVASLALYAFRPSMTFKNLVSFISSGLQWLLLSALAFVIPIVLLFGVLVYSCTGRDPI